MLYTIFFSFCRLQPLYSMCVFEGAGSKTKDPLGIGGLLYSRCNSVVTKQHVHTTVHTHPTNEPNYYNFTGVTRQKQGSCDISVVTVATSKSNLGFCSAKNKKNVDLF